MGGTKAWVKERFPLQTFNYEVPFYASTVLYSLGGITMISFVILVITGVILSQFYIPTEEAANQSLRILMTEVKFGSLIRGLHYWSAQIAVLGLILHLLRTFFYGAYKKPRELNWVIGVLLFVGMILLYYTGTVLKWDQEAYEALAHAEEATKLLGPLGCIFLGDPDLGVSHLTRFFLLHVSVVPLFMIALITVHLYLIKMLKISPLPWNSGQKEKTENVKHTFSQHAGKLVGYGLITTGVLIVLSVVLSPELGPAPVKGIEATLPSWIFMCIFAIENWAGVHGLIWASALLVFVLLLIPFIDRKESPDLEERKVFVIGGVIIIGLVIALTTIGYHGHGGSHLNMSKQIPKDQKQDSISSKDKKEQKEQKENATGISQPKNEDTNTSQKTQEEAAEIKALNQALLLLAEIRGDVKQGQYKDAFSQAKELDEVLDSIEDQVKAKNPELRKKMASAVHKLEDNLKKINPNQNSLIILITTAEQAVNETKPLFK